MRNVNGDLANKIYLTPYCFILTMRNVNFVTSAKLNSVSYRFILTMRNVNLFEFKHIK